MIKGRSVIFSEIADKIDNPVKTSSIERRIQSFFQKAAIDYQKLALFLLSFIHHDKLTLSIDRTEWDYGKTQVNILCVVVSIGKMGVPLYFEMLDNNSGNSNSNDRIELFKKIISTIGKERIQMLIMDREFIGYKWLSWLKLEKINFCVRVPKHHKVLTAQGDLYTVDELISTRKSCVYQDVIVDNVAVNLSLSYDADGELLYLIGTVNPCELKTIYKKRWSIEVVFQAFKGRGFNLEKSCLRSLEKYKKLLTIVCIAYTICWATGLEESLETPVKTKKHGYPQYRVFRRGLNCIREIYKSKNINIIDRIIQKATQRIFKHLKIVG